ncbi:MAG: PA14 domain-containing protein [Verrucomicrobia bacterium]|nr:PA14 domain-containing protein [Verrucomicrobiota bacterium]
MTPPALLRPFGIAAAILLAGACQLQAASDVTVSTGTTSGGAFAGTNPNVFTPTAATAVANNGTIQNSLNGGNAVTIGTASAAGGTGDLTIASAIAKTAGLSSTLTLDAVRDLAINGVVSASTGAMPLVLTAGRNLSNSQPLTSNGGNITLSPTQTFTLGAAVNAGAGQVAIQTGSVESASAFTITGGGVQVAAAAALRLQGTVAGPLTVAGTVSPAQTADTGALQVNGTLTLQGTATNVVDLGGTAEGSTFDRITATGAVTLAGALQVNLVNNFHDTISGSSVFTIVRGSSVTGTFTGYPNGSRFTLANDYGSLRVNYTATTVTLDDWKPVIVNLTWDPGTAEAGTQVFSNTNTRAGRHYFRVLTQGTDIGAWRTRLTLAVGDAALYLSKTNLPTTGSYQFLSAQTGSDGFVLRDDQFAPGEEWYLLVNATAGAQWSLFSGRAYVHDLGPLPFTDANGNSQYDIGEAVTPQTDPATPMPPEGIRFYQATVPVGTPAWSLWLNGSGRELALRTNKVPFHTSTGYYTRKQAGQMLVVPTVLGTGSNAYFLSVVAPQGESIGLDSRIQTVTDIAFQSTTANVAVTGPPYRVFRTSVPIDQLAWDVSTTVLAGNPNVCVRKNNVPGEWDNEAFSEAPGSTTDSVTLVPDFLTNGTWFVTVYGTGNYTFTLKSGDPVITPMNFTDVKTNDQTTRAGWRYYALTNIPAQVGSLGWELLLANQVPGTQIALRRNKVPSRWLFRANGNLGTPSDIGTQYMDYHGEGGFLQRPGHQADVWYVGIYTPLQPLGAFTLDAHPIVPATVGFDGSNTAVAGLEPGRWKFQRIDVPAGVLGWDLRVKNIASGTPSMIVRRDLLPDSASGNWGSPEANPTWPTGNSWAGGVDWTGRTYEVYAPPYPQVGDRLVMAMGRPLEPGTYYVGVYNSHATIAAAYTVESRGLGTGQTITVADLSYAAGSNASVTNLAPREAAYFKVTIPPNTPSWEFTLAPSAGEMMMAMRRSTVPDFSATGVTTTGVQYDSGTSGSREVEMQKTGPERYLVLPRNDEDFIVAGDYYIAVISEGQSVPNGSTIGTGTSSGVLTSLGAFGTTSLGAASLAGITQTVSLVGAQVKSYQFTVPAGTVGLELRLDNRVGDPVMSLISGSRIPQPGITSAGYSYYGYDGGQYSVPAGGVNRLYDGNLITVANPPAGTYSLTVRAEAVSSDYPAATADLVIRQVVNPPVPLGFDGATAVVSGHLPVAWRYFTVTVPAGVLGWDLRLKNITGGTPSMIVRRDVLPNSPSGNWGSPETNPTWPSGNSWAGRLDWTGRTYEVYAPPYPQVGDRLVMAMGRPLEPGTYYVGVYNSHATIAAAYTLESRGIGTGQTITVADFNPAAGSNTPITNLTPREAAYFKVTIPANTPSWEFTLAPSAGEMMMAMRRGTVPDFSALGTTSTGVQYDTGTSGSREIEMQKTGPERYLMLPRDDQDFIVAGDYYIAVISEGQSPPTPSTIGTGTSSGVLTSLGVFGTTDLGTASLGGITQPVSLVGAQVKSYQFTVPVGTASLEVRLDNRVGDPVMSLISGSRIPQPGATSNNYSYYDFDGGQYSAKAGALSRIYENNLITLANPLAGTYSVTVRAEAVGSDYPAASADLVIVALAPVPLSFNGGTATVAGQSPTAWRYFTVTVPAGVLGWDLRLKNVTGGTPGMVVRRDVLPNSPGGNWGSPETSPTWPSGNSWAGVLDWTGRSYEVYVAPYPQVADRLVMAMGRPLEPGTYYVGVYNSHATIAAAYSVESRGIGTGQSITVADFNPAAGSTTTITNLVPREAAYFKVTIPPNTPSWEFTLAPSAGEMMMAMRRGTVPDFSALGTTTTGVQYDSGTSGSREIEMQKPGPERYLVLPRNDADFIVAGDYYIAVISEGINPPNTSTIGTGTSSGVLTSLGTLGTTSLGAASLAGITQPVSLVGAQVKSYQFTVPVDTASLELRLDNRVANPVMSVISGSRIPQPGITSPSYSYYGYDGGQYAMPAGGLDRLYESNLITLTNPPAGTYSLTVRAEVVSSDYPDATANLVVRQLARLPLNYAASLNGNGLSHTATRQLLDTQKDFFEVAVPTTLAGQPVIGWLIKMNNLQGDTTLKIYKTWGNSATGITVSGNTALVVPPFLTPGDTWFVEVTGTGLTNYTITSLPITLERPVWAMPVGHNTTFGDSGNDSAGNPLPGDRGVDIGQDDWQFYAIDVPDGNAGLLRTELQAINGNPNLYIREDGVPTTDHNAAGAGGTSLVDRSLTSTASEYGNWVPLDGRYEKQLRAGRWYLGVKASGASNARYRLKVSTGQVTDLALNGASVAGQNLVGRDWRYYRFTVPQDAPNTWSLTFSQQVGDVNLWLRDTLPPGNNTDGLETASTTYSAGLRTWSSDNKNQGPYSTSGQDAAGSYPFNTPPLRPGHTYYAGFRAANDATFSFSTATSGGSIGVLPELDYYTGSINTSLAAGASLFYRIPVPPEATRMKWSATHPASVQLRLEQGTLPGATGSQHWTSGSSANVAFNQALSATVWPWQPNHDYYLRVINTSGSAQTVTLAMSGRNATNEDEDADGLPDAWELLYFPSIGTTNGTGDPDGDGVTNAVEFTDGTIPNNVNSAKYFLTITPSGGTAAKSPDQPKYDRGAVVNLTDTPLANYAFLGWQRTGSYGDDFAVQVTGTVTIPAAGTYTFGTNAADGLRLKVNNVAVITDDSTHAVTDKFGQLVLAAGTYPLELEAFEYNSGEALELFAAAGSHASFNSNFKLLGDTANGGLLVQTLSGGSTVAGLTVQQIIGVGTGNIYNLARMDDLLTGTRAKRAETTRIARTINYLGSASADGHFTANAIFPLLQPEPDNPLALGMFGDYTITAVNTVPLPLAVDAPALVFTTTGEAPWLGQITTTRDGVDAAQSGPIGHSQESWCETTVTGSGSLSFWWKVSSETGFDYLEFYLDGALQSSRISGNVDWQQQTYPLAAGMHTLRWRYAKDASVTAGADAGWVDQLGWTPTGGTPYSIWQAANFSPAQIADPLVSGPAADPEQDGITNLLEFAFNLPPLVSDQHQVTPGSGAEGLPHISVVQVGGQPRLRFEYVRRRSGGITYLPQASDAMAASGPGSWELLTGVPVVTAINAQWDRVVVEDVAGTGHPSRFGRVQLTMP